MCSWVELNIFNYDKNQKLQKAACLVLKGLTTGQNVANNKCQTYGEYSYDVILMAFKANKDKHKQKVLNYTLHRLPYSRFLEIVNFLRIKYSIDIIIVNSAFTSIIGKLKYSYKYKLPTHIAASYVIGRRALGFSDSPLKHQNRYLTDIINKSEWTKWSYLNKIT